MKINKFINMKTVGYLSSIFSLGVSFLTAWVDAQKTEEMIDKKIDEAITELRNRGES